MDRDASNACDNCGAVLPEGSRFCPACGIAIAQSGDTNRTAPAAPQPADADAMGYTRIEPRLFGALPATTTLLIGVTLLLAGLIAAVTGQLTVALILIVLGIAGLALFIETTRRRPQGRLGRATASGLMRLRERTAFLFTSADAWTRAGRDVIRLRAERRRLAQTRERTQYELGGAAYNEDEERIHSIREQLRELDQQTASRTHEIELATARAREHIARERRTIQPTEVVPILDGPASDDSARDRGGPST